MAGVWSTIRRFFLCGCRRSDRMQAQIEVEMRERGEVEMRGRRPARTCSRRPPPPPLPLSKAVLIPRYEHITVS